MYVIVTALLTFWTVISANEKYGGDWHLECPVTQCKCPEKYATNLPHETDCTKFYKCDWCRPILQDCPVSKVLGYKRLHYNRRLQVCDWPWSAGCISCPIPEHNKCSNENGTISDPNNNCNSCSKENEKISNPDDDCNSYFECVNGVKERHYCRSGTCFSRTCQDCVVNRAGGNCDGSGKNGTCEVGDRKCHDCNCRSFYECKQIQENSNVGWLLSSCEGGLYYNPISKSCDTADIALPLCVKECLNGKNKKY